MKSPPAISFSMAIDAQKCLKFKAIKRWFWLATSFTQFSIIANLDFRWCVMSTVSTLIIDPRFWSSFRSIFRNFHWRLVFGLIVIVFNAVFALAKLIHQVDHKCQLPHVGPFPFLRFSWYTGVRNCNHHELWVYLMWPLRSSMVKAIIALSLLN